MDNNENQEELFIPKTKHKALKILLAIILVAGLVAGGYFIYQKKFNNPQRIVADILEDAKNNLNGFFNIAGNKGDKYKVNGLVKIDGSLPNELSDLMNLIKDLNFQFNGEIDIDNQKANIDLNTKYKNDKLVNIKSYYEKDTIYILLEDIFDKYIKITDEALEEKPIELPHVDLTTDETKTLVNSLIDAFKKEIEARDLTKEEITIKVNDNNVNVLNNYLVLNDNEINVFAKNIVNHLSNDNNFLPIMKKLTTEDPKKALNNIIKNIDEDENSFKGKYQLNFYTTKGLLKKELVRFSQEITIDEQKTFLDIDKLSNNEIMITANSSGMEMSSRIKKNNSAISINLKVNMMGMIIKVDADLNYEKINELSKVDISDFKKLEDLTEKDQEKIDENLGKNKNIVKFIEELQKLFTQNEV